MYQELSIKVAQIEDFKANQYFEIQKGMDAKYQDIDRTCNTFKADIITMLDEKKTDNKLIIEKMKIMINNNSNRLDLLTKDKNGLQGNINEMKI